MRKTCCPGPPHARCKGTTGGHPSCSPSISVTRVGAHWDREGVDSREARGGEGLGPCLGTRPACTHLHMSPDVQASSQGSWGCLMVQGRCVWGCPRVLDEEARWATSPRAVVHCEGQPSTLGAPLLESAYMTRYLGAKHDWTCVGKLEGPCMHLWLKGAGHSRLWRRSPITITPILPWYLVCTSKEGPCSVLDQNGEGG